MLTVAVVFLAILINLGLGYALAVAVGVDKRKPPKFDVAEALSADGDNAESETRVAESEPAATH